jgi:hypothetical protein
MGCVWSCYSYAQPFSASPAAEHQYPPDSTQNPGASLLVGSLNLCGDCHNPLEFLALANDRFMENYRTLERCAKALRLTEVHEFIQSIRVAKYTIPEELQESLSAMEESAAGNGGAVWNYFQEEVLRNDNKIVDNRFNLLTMATSPLNDFGADIKDEWGETETQQWHVLRDRAGGSSALASIFGRLLVSYLRDTQLFLWDAVCTIVASKARDAYIDICVEAFCNPENFSATAQAFFGRMVDEAKRNNVEQHIIVGLQEWPSEGTTRRAIYTKELEKQGCSIIASSASVAVAYSNAIFKQRHDDITETINPTEVMQGLIDEFEASGAQIDAKEKKGLLTTTARKTLIICLAGSGINLSVVVVHAKEPKKRETAQILAKFIQAVGKRSPQPWIAACDTNMASKAIGDPFEEEMKQVEHAMVPGMAQDTTSKHRSLLHGQCYNDKKCLKTVTAPKDKLIASKGLTFEGVSIFPPIQGTAAETLPTPAWASDHCIVTALCQIPRAVLYDYEVV